MSSVLIWASLLISRSFSLIDIRENTAETARTAQKIPKSVCMLRQQLKTALTKSYYGTMILKLVTVVLNRRPT